MIITQPVHPGEAEAALRLIEDEFKGKQIRLDVLGTDEYPPMPLPGLLIAVATALGSGEPLLIVGGGSSPACAVLLSDVCAIGHEL